MGHQQGERPDRGREHGGHHGEPGADTEAGGSTVEIGTQQQWRRQNAQGQRVNREADGHAHGFGDVRPRRRMTSLSPASSSALISPTKCARTAAVSCSPPPLNASRMSAAMCSGWLSTVR